MRSGRVQVVLLALALFVAGACGSANPASKAGGVESVTVLRIGIADDPGTIGGDQLELYRQLVEDGADGSLRLEPVWDAARRGGGSAPVVDDWEQVVARRLTDGDLDLAVVPSRAWDTEGVTTLRALNAPLVVTSDEMVEQVVLGDLTDDLLAGLGAIDVVGLALLPVDMRHLFVFGGATPQTLDGGIVRSPRSETVYEFFRALNSDPDDVPAADAELGQRIDRGEVTAAESSFTGAMMLPRTGTAIGNVTLFPKLNSLVARGDSFDSLSAEHRSLLRSAADALVVRALEQHVPDSEAASRYCREMGGSVIDATPEEIAAIERAAAAVHDMLNEDPSTRSLLQRLRELSGADTTIEGVPACGPPKRNEPPVTVIDPADEFPEGTFRMEMPVEVLADAGVPGPDATEHSGLWTMTLADGRIDDPTCPGGTYAVHDGRITFTLGPAGEGCGSAAGKVLFSAAWEFDGKELQFLDVRSGHGSDLLIETLFGSLPFTKIR